jgi:hypothetical protein
VANSTFCFENGSAVFGPREVGNKNEQSHRNRHYYYSQLHRLHDCIISIIDLLGPAKPATFPQHLETVAKLTRIRLHNPVKNRCSFRRN